MSQPESRPRMRLSTGKKLAMAAFTLLVLALVAEVGTRVLFRVQGKSHEQLILSSADPGMKIQGRYVSHPFLPFALRPDSEHRIVWTPPPWPELEGASDPHVWQIHHNSWGFRGREIALEKPANGLRVVCLGGSTTYDTVTDGKTWTEKLERNLAEAYPDRTVEVLNFGMNAASMPFHITQLALLGAHFKPDLVILYAGHNDLWSGLGLEGFRPDYSHRLGHWDDSRRSVQRFVPGWTLKSAAVTGLLVAIDRWRGIEYDLVRQIWRNAPPSDDPLEGFWGFENGMLTIRGIANAHGGKLLVVTPFWSFRKDERATELIERIAQAAADHDIALLDAANVVPEGDVSLVVDDVHFSDKGGTLFADLLAEFIRNHGLLDSAGQ